MQQSLRDCCKSNQTRFRRVLLHVRYFSSCPTTCMVCNHNTDHTYKKQFLTKRKYWECKSRERCMQTTRTRKIYYTTYNCQPFKCHTLISESNVIEILGFTELGEKVQWWDCSLPFKGLIPIKFVKIKHKGFYSGFLIHLWKLMSAKDKEESKKGLHTFALSSTFDSQTSL